MELRSVIVLAVLLPIGGARAAYAQSSEITAGKKIDAIFSPLGSPDAPGFAVLVRKDGQTIFERGYGVRDLRLKAKIDANTNFRLASFTKQFTAMAIMLLVHDGKLRYDETLTEIFPGFPAYGKTITVRNLLNHTSGLPDYEDLMLANRSLSPVNEGQRRRQGLFLERFSASVQFPRGEVLSLAALSVAICDPEARTGIASKKSRCDCSYGSAS